MINLMSKRIMNLSNQFSTATSSLNSSNNNIDFIQGNGLPKIILNKPKALNSLNLQMVR